MQPHEINKIAELLKRQGLHIEFVSPVGNMRKVLGAYILDYTTEGILVQISMGQGMVNTLVPWTNIAAIYPG